MMPAASFCSIVARRPERLHADRRDEGGQHDTGKANHHWEEPRHNMSRRQIAVTDRETGLGFASRGGRMRHQSEKERGREHRNRD